MPRVDPLDRADLAAHEPGFARVEQMMGFVPNSMFTMPRVPGVLEGFHSLASAVLMNDLIPNDLKQLIALMASAGAGCRYCQAHTGHSAQRMGVPFEKLESVWQFETSAHFSDAERAALRVAFHAGQVPNAATDEDFANLKQYWNDDQVAAIVAVISLFGFLNRWNDTMATTLEATPIAFAEKTLAANGWEQGKHR